MFYFDEARVDDVETSIEELSPTDTSHRPLSSPTGAPLTPAHPDSR